MMNENDEKPPPQDFRKIFSPLQIRKILEPIRLGLVEDDTVFRIRNPITGLPAGELTGHEMLEKLGPKWKEFIKMRSVDGDLSAPSIPPGPLSPIVSTTSESKNALPSKISFSIQQLKQQSAARKARTTRKQIDTAYQIKK